MTRPLCFALLPSGRMPDAAGRIIDFDAVYRELVAPAIERAGMDAERADEHMADSTLSSSMFEQMILSEYAVLDLTTAGANVFYELGLRHAVSRGRTVAIVADGGARTPFDAGTLRALPYALTPHGTPDHVDGARTRLAARLGEARHTQPDSPVYQLVDEFPGIQRLKTDVFRDRVHYSPDLKAQLAGARKQGVDAVRRVGAGLGPIADVEAAVVIDLFLSYRSVGAWNDMIALVDRMARPLAATLMVREQLGMALNRAGRGEEAERLLTRLIDERGSSSETCGILGRVYKDQWEAAEKAGQSRIARGLLDKASAAYLKGFESDWRDAYPGINAVTLMELKEPPDPRRDALIPVVRYAVERRIAAGEPDYWDHATRLELAVLGRDEARAAAALADALASVREAFEPETTARNLRLIREARERRHQPVPWAVALEEALLRRSRSVA